MSHLLVTGPVEGVYSTSDGTEYDVTPGTIICASQEHAEEIAEKIRLHWVNNPTAHPNVDHFEDHVANPPTVAEEPPADPAPEGDPAAPATLTAAPETPEA